jgi:hypothetical protein
MLVLLPESVTQHLALQPSCRVDHFYRVRTKIVTFTERIDNYQPYGSYQEGRSQGWAGALGASEASPTNRL